MMTPEQVFVVHTYSAQPHPFAMATCNSNSRLEVYPSPHTHIDDFSFYPQVWGSLRLAPMKNPPFDSLVWGSLRLAPISGYNKQ